MTSRQRGVGLIEVLLSVVLISVGVVGLIKLQAYMDKKAEFAIKSTEALYLAEAKLEYFLSRSQDGADGTIQFDTIGSGSETTGVYTLNWTVSEPGLTPELNSALKVIEISASWKNREAETESVQLKTMLSKFSEFD
ncbi:pilus assembly protein PilV [Vibrio albus]|uniref:Pilus assembly protein PilV n=1 Tax=Vibrio albus TaxID=2200953 RepID=A0A2U3BD54_9VIBR|nr:prepilin-type N-terminal cleavage/methylation domain-containing protein [Vibrio albus]PWI34695.1 pilus assembly protein PilV [Vibrio albus]